MRCLGVGVSAALAAAVAAGNVAGAAEPTCVNGLAQSVFSANTADWIRVRAGSSRPSRWIRSGRP
jgi:hypothetical protein